MARLAGAQRLLCLDAGGDVADHPAIAEESAVLVVQRIAADREVQAPPVRLLDWELKIAEGSMGVEVRPMHLQRRGFRVQPRYLPRRQSDIGVLSAAAGEAQVAIELPVGVDGDVGKIAKLPLAGREIGERALPLGDVLPEHDDAADAAVALMPGLDRPAIPFDNAVWAQEGISLAALAGAGKAASVDFATAQGLFGHHVIDAAPDDVLIAQAMPVAVGVTGRKVAHLAVEPGEARGRSIDAALPRARCGGRPHARLRVCPALPLASRIPESGRRQPGYCHGRCSQESGRKRAVRWVSGAGAGGPQEGDVTKHYMKKPDATCCVYQRRALCRCAPERGQWGHRNG